MVEPDFAFSMAKSAKDEEKQASPLFPHRFFPFITLQMRTVCGEYVV
jgi:hypothetical protein